TLLSLVPRLYDPSEGAVLWGGVDLRDARLRDVRRRVGVVSQQAQMLGDTVAENIAYGRPGATRAQIEAAAKQAHAHAFITGRLADGYDTLVGPGGGRLSGGQRQRIALARAILRDPELLILDEATSQIDVESETLIHRTLAGFVRDRTTLLITHRPSTLTLADRVVVMEQGRVLDVGTPDELEGRCDLFRRLCCAPLLESA
ncbi:MAG: ATP-binding cassette domain-containing protein, partial [Planctomycetota bacterium]